LTVGSQQSAVSRQYINNRTIEILSNKTTIAMKKLSYVIVMFLLNSTLLFSQVSVTSVGSTAESNYSIRILSEKMLNI
jgi:hypothetical protein